VKYLAHHFCKHSYTQLMSARQEIHLGLVIDAGDILVVQRKRIPEYEGMDDIARSLPGGLMVDSDLGPASAVRRSIMAQTGFTTNISEQPLLSWKQHDDCTHPATRYHLWTGVLAEQARMPVSDETIDNSGLVAIRGLSPYMIGRIRMKFLRELIRDSRSLKYEYS
jgi:hypothetical protein